jgi:hypothetical protein
VVCVCVCVCGGVRVVVGVWGVGRYPISTKTAAKISTFLSFLLLLKKFLHDPKEAKGGENKSKEQG